MLNLFAVETDAQPLALVVGECPSCRQSGAQQLTRLHQRATALGLPYRPGRRQCFLTCCTCGRSHEVSAAAARSMQQSSAAAASFEAAVDARPVVVRRRDFVL